MYNKICRLERKVYMLKILSTVILIAWAISAVGLVICVLMHSGKGTGLSEGVASGLGTSGTGTAIVERNLDRLTIIMAVVFIMCLLLMMKWNLYPVGSIK